jgi:hypothetical protein
VDDADGVDIADVLNVTSGVTYSPTILSKGVDPGTPAALHYQPQGAALDRIPEDPYTVEETYGSYFVEEGATNDFLAILLARIEAHYGLSGFAAAFTSDFETYLTTVDTDEDEPGVQPHVDPYENPIFALAETLWFGPEVTWPKEIFNYAYIMFWHRLDEALMAEGIPGMGPELLGDDAWTALFTSGHLPENEEIYLSLGPRSAKAVLCDEDQTGNARPSGAKGDIGAIEGP